MQCVRDRYPGFFSPATKTMQLFMWQLGIVGRHTTVFIILRCLVPSMMSLMRHQSHLHRPWRLGRCIQM